MNKVEGGVQGRLEGGVEGDKGGAQIYLCPPEGAEGGAVGGARRRAGCGAGEMAEIISEERRG